MLCVCKLHRKFVTLMWSWLRVWTGNLCLWKHSDLLLMLSSLPKWAGIGVRLLSAASQCVFVAWGGWCPCSMFGQMLGIKYTDQHYIPQWAILLLSTYKWWLEVPHPSLLGDKSPNKAFGKKVPLALLPKHPLSLLSSFSCPHSSVFWYVVILGSVFCGGWWVWVFYFAIWKSFFSVDVEGGDTYSWKRSLSHCSHWQSLSCFTQQADWNCVGPAWPD